MSESQTDDKLRIFYNTNITMSRGKLAAHAVHAALTAAGVHPDIPVVVLGAKPRDIAEMCTSIRDNGVTELDPGTLTTGTDFIFDAPAVDHTELTAWLHLYSSELTGPAREQLLHILRGPDGMTTPRIEGV